jgi:hypothetical protein
MIMAVDRPDKTASALEKSAQVGTPWSRPVQACASLKKEAQNNSNVPAFKISFI